ncbi:ATP-dependent nuclease [[Micrococcus luteus] ATCC 49442]|uniref:ATP-dependent nuclease n=1 Tax=[Micrococcus luteus] ATCC 49442 TaxID=2698727 RepID=UPI0013DB1382|nr:AAA family ATPase [[Micrococcus luteus] ATCC 49442]
MIERIIVRGYRLFRDFELEPNAGVNIVVGGNEAGKSTLLEAISLGLTGRVNGRRAEEELNPYWFNRDMVKEYFAAIAAGESPPPPEILVELYMNDTTPDVQMLRAVYNSRAQDAPGLSVRIMPSPDYAQELAEYLRAPNRPDIIPVEYYEVVWKDFSGAAIRRRPKGLGVSFIDARTIRSSWGLDYHTREMLGDFVEAKERAAISVAHRTARHEISSTALIDVNKRIAEQGTKLHDKNLGLQMDQSAGASWETNVVPHVGEVPFALSGQGQQAAIKVALAMNRSAADTSFVLIEEPENHLSHTSLTRLIARIETLAGGRQVFITTHSSYVLNRLGLDKLRLLHAGTPASFAAISQDTVRYFKRLSGFDTLRIVLAGKLVLAEGPSDEMLFERAFIDKYGKTPSDAGIDVMSMSGVALGRAMELAAVLDRQVAGIRDNDGKPPAHWESKVAEHLDPGKRRLFIGDPALGRTLEPQLLHVNDEATLRSFFGIRDATKATLEWMADHKTESALLLAESPSRIKYPDYLMAAIEFVA